jgi:CRP/FNR family transcriptional regulator, cyclic AMP receptor protein
VRDTTPKTILDMLAAVPLFSACTRSELRSIANLGTQVSVADGTQLTTQGRPGMEFFLVVDGEVRCLVDGELVSTLGVGEFFGEISLLDHRPRSATVVATGKTTVLAFDVSEFHGLLKSSPSISQKIRDAAAERDRPHESVTQD